MGSQQAPDLEARFAPDISREEIQARLGEPSFVLVNVLPHEAFAAGHIPGSINLSVAEIPWQARDVLPDPSRDIAVYCASPT